MREENETGNRERVPGNHVDVVPEIDYLSGGDFLELRDLQNPASPSSSSDSSCLTMSSDECFDALELSQDLKSERGLDSVQNNAGCKLSVFATSRPTEMVMYPASTGTPKDLPFLLLPLSLFLSVFYPFSKLTLSAVEVSLNNVTNTLD